MIKRFLLVIGAVCMFSVLTAAPAFAATVRFVPPTPSGGQTVTGTQTIQVEASPNCPLLLCETVERIAVTIKSRSGGPAREYSGAGNSLRFSWDTKPLSNGGYDLEAVVTASGSQPERSTISNVMVNNPPARPSGVKGALQESSVSLTWNANNEPDLTGYEVRRSANNGPFTKVADVKSATYKDTSAPVDQPLRYQVVASRRSASGGSIQSAPSEPSSALTVPPPAPAAPPPPAPAAAAGAPAPAPGVAQSPAAQKFVGRASFKTLPRRDVGFEPTLPYAAPIPEKFEPAFSDPSLPKTSATDTDGGQFSGSLTQVHPARFLAAGLLLLVTSAHLARASRRLLKPGGSSSRRAAPASPVGQGT